MSLREALPEITASKSLKPYSEDLKRMHNIQALRFHAKDNTKIPPPK
jgi:hypothetical protein